MTILESLQYLARQTIPLRGHGDDKDSNFFQLLNMRGKSFPELKDWLNKKQGKFVTHEIQNEILKLMSNAVLRSLLKTIRGNMYSIMCDEYTDIANKEQLTFCLRWVTGNLEVHENFLGFYEIPDIKSATIVSVIKDTLTRYQLSLDMCRGSVLRRCKQHAWKIFRSCSTNTKPPITCALYSLPRTLTVTICQGCHKNNQNFARHHGHSRRDHYLD